MQISVSLQSKQNTPFGIFAPKDFYITWLPNYLILRVVDDCYFKNTKLDLCSITILYLFYLSVTIRYGHTKIIPQTKS